MNPFEKFIVESTENEMTRSFSFGRIFFVTK